MTDIPITNKNRFGKNDPLPLGKIFGDLTILGEGKSIQYAGGTIARIAVCRCICGEICKKNFYYIRTGRTVDCGCKSMRNKKAYIKIGTRYGKLTTISENYREGCDSRIKCVCDCGKEVSPSLTRLLSGVVTACFGKNCKARNIKKTGKIEEYNIWCGIKARTGNPKSKAYKDYGGRGILMCDDWKENFDQFYNDMGPRPSKRHSIDRINVNGNYEPSNCRWATWIEQANNKRNSVIVTHNGERITVKRIAEITGLSKEWLYINLRANQFDLNATIALGIQGLVKFIKT